MNASNIYNLKSHHLDSIHLIFFRLFENAFLRLLSEIWISLSWTAPF